MPSTCTFAFDRVQPIYYSGEIINGLVTLETTKEKDVREVYIQFEGDASVRWSETETRTVNGKSESHTVWYTAHTQYAFSRTRVYPEGILPRGLHTYNYSIPLPVQCPSSYDRSHGKIKYKLSLVINRTLRFDNNFEQDVEIRQQLDLNLSPGYRVPVQLEDIKRFCCWPCYGGKAILTFTIPQSGFTSDEALPYSAEIDNTSMGYDIEGFSVKLHQIHTYTAHSPRTKTRTDTLTLVRDDHTDKVLRLTKRRFEGALEIPGNLLPSTLDDCIVAIRYSLEVTMKTGSCHSNSDSEMNIVIGNIPLYNNNFMVPVEMMVEPSAPEINQPNEGFPPSYEEVAAPSYEQATAKMKEGSTKYQLLKS